MLKFKNGKFRILQLSDMQDTHRTSQDTVNFTAQLIKKTKPDLIVLTGDQVKGYGTYFKFGDSRTNAAMTLSNLLKPIADSKIPFTAVFGNHDAFGEADKDFQWSCYKVFNNFIGENYEFDAMPIYSENGNNAIFCVYTFDSHEKHNGSYIPIKQEQIDSYKAVRDSYYNKYGKYLPALAFQHIPPAEIYEALEVCGKYKKGALQGAGAFSKNYYRLPSYAVGNGSFMGENAASPDEKSGQIEAFKEKGDVLGLYFGHDHNNSFTVKHGDLDLGYTQGCGFNIYGPGKNRGGRVFDIKESTPSEYSTFAVTCKDLDDFRLERPVKSFIYTHSPSSVSQAVKIIKRTTAVTGILTCGLLAIKKLTKR